MADVDVEQLVENANGESITSELLTDSGTVKTGLISKSHYDSILSHLDGGEQPHFVERFEEGPQKIGTLERHEEGHMKTTVVTDRRVFFYSTEHHYSVPFEKISEIRTEDNLVVVHSGGEQATFPMFPSKRKKAAAHIRERMHELQSGEAATPQRRSSSERLEELTDMYENGLVDEDGYEQKKEEILDDL